MDAQVLSLMFDDLETQGWSARSGLFPAPLCSALYREALERREAADFRAARIGQGAARLEVNAMRGDEIAWIEAGQGTSAGADFLAEIDILRSALSAHFFLSLNAYEAHFACYEAGRFYLKHLDRFQRNQDRELSTVLFLNPEWTHDDGGALILYDPQENDRIIAEITPTLGTFVLFRSGDFPHEVRAPQRSRYSIAGWLKRTEAWRAAIDGLMSDASP